MDFVTLGQLAMAIRAAVSEHTAPCWVAAEIARISVNAKSGHCYLELVEKSGEATVAQMKAAIWAGSFRTLGASFREKTGAELASGMKVLVYARAVYHEVYGLSLNVTDIDPSYTLGEMELKRRQAIERLTREGIIDLNRRLGLSPAPQRIAVVSSSTAAGYGDFLSRLIKNPYGFGFGVTLYEAYMQGVRAEGSVLAALREIRKSTESFDAAVIIRGGGSKAELHLFDSYAIAREAALLPIPVLTGIGHERDETVLDRVAHMRLITPTAAAEFIVAHTRGFDDLIEGLRSSLLRRVEDVISANGNRLAMLGSLLNSSSRRHTASRRHGLHATAKDFDHASVRALARTENRLEGLNSSLRIHARHFVRARAERLLEKEGRVRLLDPLNVLRRGYSITRAGGKAVRDASTLTKGDIIHTELMQGSVASSVEEVSDGKQEKTLL